MISNTDLHPRNIGFSPGAAVSDSFFRDIMCAKADTVAATNQGRPSTEQMAIVIATISKSK